MKTEDLISALAADTMPRAPVGQQLGSALLVAIGVSLAAFAVFWGPRPDIWAALGSFAVLKTLVPLAFVLLALAFALAMVHPGFPHKRRGTALGALIALAALTFMIALAREGQVGLVSALSTPSLVTCLLSIPALAMPLLAAAIWGLSSGASTRPRLTGATAGLVAGGVAAAIYSLYCDKDMMLFVLPAYATAIGTVMLAGALLGPRILKW
ncbi:MAG: DUF1109 domain-containing protein [Natronohydrobacter sp.]|nr:DUF1109 domain-containing protein [Natronohydrobacter sp.]